MKHSLLIGAQSRSRPAEPERPKTYDHNLVRTDARARTLDTFVRQVTIQEVSSGDKRSEPTEVHADSNISEPPAEEDDWDPIRMRPRKRAKTAHPTAAEAVVADEAVILE